MKVNSGTEADWIKCLLLVHVDIVVGETLFGRIRRVLLRLCWRI